ncbi:MAG: hypothetical protein HC767_06615 [Akkermansiaceae bacterium]|nr:hypothetical protein [Akkermansiaceae bacterium]
MAVPEGAGWHDDAYSGSDAQHVDNFIADIEQQEGGDHHNTMGIIRTGIATQLHIDMKPNTMHAITREYTARALNAWRTIPGLWLLGEGQGGFNSEDRLPVISFNVLVKRFHPVSEARGSGCMILHHNFVASVLNDVYGIQVRSAPHSFACTNLVHVTFLLHGCMASVCEMHSWCR